MLHIAVWVLFLAIIIVMYSLFLASNSARAPGRP